MALLKQTVRKIPHSNVLQENYQTFIIHNHDHLTPTANTADFINLSLPNSNNNSTSTSTPIYELGKHLLNAAKNGNVSEIKSLMGRGAAFTPDWLGSCPLHYAASSGHAHACEVLLRAGISRNSRTKVERTPLHMAVYAGHIDVVETLIKHGADVNAKDMLQMTPLQWAVQRCNQDDCCGGGLAMVNCLLKHGAKAKMKNKFDNTALDIAQQLGHVELIEVIQKAVDREQQLDQLDGEADLVVRCEDKRQEQPNSDDQTRQVNEFLNDVVQLTPTIDKVPEQEQQQQQQLVTIEDCIDDDVGHHIKHADSSNNNNKMLTDNGYCSSTSVDQQTKPVEPTASIIHNIDLTDESEVVAATTVVDDEDPYRLLRQRYGIELLPEVEEDGGRILKQAMNSGHSVSLTEAGKRALRAFKLQDEQSTGHKQLHQVVNYTAKVKLNNLARQPPPPPVSINIVNTVAKRKRILPFTCSSAMRQKNAPPPPQIVLLQQNNNARTANNIRINVQPTADRISPSGNIGGATTRDPIAAAAAAVPHNLALRQTVKQMRPLRQQQQPQETALLTLTADEFAGLQANGGFVTTNNGIYRIMDYNNHLSSTAANVVINPNGRVINVKPADVVVSGGRQSHLQHQQKESSDIIETLRHQLQEQRHLVDVYKRKYLKKEAEAERFKQQLKLMLKHRSSNKNLCTAGVLVYNNNENKSR